MADKSSSAAHTRNCWLAAGITPSCIGGNCWKRNWKSANRVQEFRGISGRRKNSVLRVFPPSRNCTNMQEEEVLGKAYDSRLMRRLITYLRPYKSYVALALVLILFESALEVTFPWFTKIAIDEYIASSNMRGLAAIAGVYVILLFVRFAVASAETYVLQNTGQQIMYD